MSSDISVTGCCGFEVVSSFVLRQPGFPVRRIMPATIPMAVMMMASCRPRLLAIERDFSSSCCRVALFFFMNAVCLRSSVTLLSD